MILLYILLSASSAMIVIICTQYIILKLEKTKLGAHDNCCASNMEKFEPFSVSTYLDRIEKAWLEILEDQEPMDHAIVLWLGLDGLRLNEDGTTEWISRKKPEPVKENVFYQPRQSVLPPAHQYQLNMCQSTQATTEQIFAFKMQLNMMSFNTAFQGQTQGFNSALQGCMIQAPMYPSYLYYGGMQAQSQLTGCCCDGTILR